MRADAIVVGAGPAGSAAALTLARGGARVLLIERTDFPREKACGDGLAPRAVAQLSDLGIDIATEPRIDLVRIWAPDEPSKNVALQVEGLSGTTLARLTLDERLARAAVESGAELCNRTTAEALVVEGGTVCGVRFRSGRGARGIVRAPVTLLAEGSAGGLARQAPLAAPRRRERCFAVRRYLDGIRWQGPPAFEFVIPIEVDGEPLAGYGWIFPMPDGRANVGVGRLAETGPTTQLRSLLEWFEQMLRRSDTRFASARAAGAPIGGPILVGGTGATSHAPGLLLVGDSARLPDPLWLEGISRAVESGALAARSALNFLSDGSPLESYGRELASVDPDLDRIGASLSCLYHNVRRVSRDVKGFFSTGSDLSRTLLAMGEAGGNAREAECESAAGPIILAAKSSERRALRLLGRERPLFGVILARLPRPRSSPAFCFLAARARFPGFETRSTELRRAATALELASLAAELLDELDFRGEQHTGSRGGTWLAATLALSLADRCLARSFALCSRLDRTGRLVVASALSEIFERRTNDALTSRVRCGSRGVSAAACARAGARLGAAGGAVADECARAAEGAAEHASPSQMWIEISAATPGTGGAELRAISGAAR